MAKRGWHTKRRVSEAGRKTGGGTFFRGHLYYMLKNRTYLGEIAHKGQVYQGRHKAIIARSTWDDVQALLNHNANDRASRKWAQNPSPLAGLLFDERGNRLTPSHTGKGSVRYRYYVCWALLQGQLDRVGSIKRVPAEEIESLVAAQVRELCSPDRLGGELARLEVAHDEQQALIKDVSRLTAKIEKDDQRAWIDLGRAVIQKIVVGPTQVQIIVDLHKLLAVCRPDDALQSRCEADGQPLTLDLVVPVRVTRSGRQKSMITLDSDGSHRLINESLVTAVARALKWDQEVRAGRSLSAIARGRGVSTTKATRIMPLAFLAPDIVQAIYDGRQPLGLKVKAASADLPLDWVAQRRALGFPAR